MKPSDKTVLEVAEDWYKRKADAGTYRRASLIDWENHVENYIKTELGDLKLYALDVERIEKAAAEWAKRVSPKMVNKVLTTLTAILALAKRYKLIKDNPAEEAERLKVATENEEDIEVMPDQVYSKADIRKLIEATDARNPCTPNGHDPCPHGIENRRGFGPYLAGRGFESREAPCPFQSC